MSEQPTPEPMLAYRHLMLAASVLLFLVGMGSFFLLIVALKPMALDFGWPRTVPSLAFSLQFIGSGIGGIVMGFWMDRAGAGRPALLGAIMLGSGAMLASQIENQWQLYLIYGVMLGLLGQSTLFTPLMTNVTLWFRDRRGMALGIVASGQSLAGVLWPPLFRYFNDTVGWRETFFWYGLLALVTMLPLSLMLRRRAPLPELEGLATAPPPPPSQTPSPTPRRRPSSVMALGCRPCTGALRMCLRPPTPLTAPYQRAAGRVRPKHADSENRSLQSFALPSRLRAAVQVADRPSIAPIGSE